MTTQVCGLQHAVSIGERINPPQLSLIPCPSLPPPSDWPDSYDPGHKDLMLGRQSKHRLGPGILNVLTPILRNVDTNYFLPTERNASARTATILCEYERRCQKLGCIT